MIYQIQKKYKTAVFTVKRKCDKLRMKNKSENVFLNIIRIVTINLHQPSFTIYLDAIMPGIVRNSSIFETIS
jgi:hypothetical protein